MKRHSSKGIRLLAFTALMLGMLGCASTPAPEETIQGTWESPDSVAVYEIKIMEGQMAVNGHSSHSGKALKISDVSWDGEVLIFTSLMPHTGHTIHHENRMIDAETMTSSATGSSTHTTTWKKQD